ncbi:hypothetical protein HDV03_000691 [Kappamyces sp. JEL0829]|nr:hypothetical protein HDV03_000691 [Kappamyces sp. JEL0829]KAJ3338416.1 hypothetical protein HDU91_001234 [Kappamyces sp. JEL0680]
MRATQRLFQSSLTPFHHAFPVYDLEATRQFYSTVLSCPQGREKKGAWIGRLLRRLTSVDFNLFGHQIVAHKVPDALQDSHRASRGVLRNHVDGHAVPIPHFGVVLEWDQLHTLAENMRRHNVKFEIEPYVRFEGQPGEQATMFFYDPSGNALEFKAFKNIQTQLFDTR